MATSARQAGRMNLWRLEWLRLIRTPRALTLLAVFIFFGLVEPVITKYQSKLLAHVGNGVRIVIPPPTPAEGMSGYIGEITGIGLIVVVVIAAGAFSFDARHGLAVFLRTRVSGSWQLVMPRYTASVAAAAVAYLLGTLAAWYETDLLIGSLPAGAVLAGYLCAAMYLAFAVAVTALAASVVRSTLASTGIALAVLLVIPIVGTFRGIHDWLPSTLVSAPVDLLAGAHQFTHYLPAFAVAVAVSAAALAIAVRRLGAREI
jgi:ABC-2 type transport system permease protein